MAAGAGRCSCLRAGGIPTPRKQQNPPCKPNKSWPMFVLTACRTDGWSETHHRKGTGQSCHQTQPQRRAALRFAPLQLHTKGMVLISPHLSVHPQGDTHPCLHMSFCKRQNPDSVQTAPSGEKRKDQWHVMAGITLLHACWKTHATSSSDHSRKHTAALRGAQPPGLDATAQSSHAYPAWKWGSCMGMDMGFYRGTRMLLSLLNVSRLPARCPEQAL